MQEQTGVQTAASPSLLSERAYAALRDRLVTLEIPPGAPIDEDALTRELGVGRTPVREAVRRLVLEGLVVVYPRRGTFASAINITSLSDITDVRTVLEAHAAARAASLADPADVDEARALVAELEALDVGQEQMIELDARIHRFVYRCCRNPYLTQDLDRYLNMSLRIWHLTSDRLPPLADRVREHRDLLEAICRGDADAARRIAGEHVNAFAAEMRAAL
ncbi:MAG: GntR family transcriptional regulator [Myxococcales bacterium]|nr:GntR family transcriptional regulator [Myxococcales bacterium]MDH5306542.1 GntR family transcriptional regulator [Myxococcales bacterium]MDH5566501.1 GntR family transcriptional regulator [Myxococcales bacterium]